MKKHLIEQKPWALSVLMVIAALNSSPFKPLQGTIDLSSNIDLAKCLPSDPFDQGTDSDPKICPIPSTKKTTSVKPVPAATPVKSKSGSNVVTKTPVLSKGAESKNQTDPVVDKNEDSENSKPAQAKTASKAAAKESEDEIDISSKPSSNKGFIKKYKSNDGKFLATFLPTGNENETKVIVSPLIEGRVCEGDCESRYTLEGEATEDNLDNLTELLKVAMAKKQQTDLPDDEDSEVSTSDDTKAKVAELDDKNSVQKRTSKKLDRIRENCRNSSDSDTLTCTTKNFISLLEEASRKGTSKSVQYDDQMLKDFYVQYIEASYVDLYSEGQSENKQAALDTIEQILKETPKKYNVFRAQVLNTQVQLINMQATMVKNAYVQAANIQQNANAANQKGDPFTAEIMNRQAQLLLSQGYAQQQQLLRDSSQTGQLIQSSLYDAAGNNLVNRMQVDNSLYAYTLQTAPTIQCIASNPNSCTISGLSLPAAQQILNNNTATINGNLGGSSVLFNGMQPAGSPSTTLAGTSLFDQSAFANRSMDNNPLASRNGFRVSEETPATQAMLSEASRLHQQYSSMQKSPGMMNTNSNNGGFTNSGWNNTNNMFSNQIQTVAPFQSVNNNNNWSYSNPTNFAPTPMYNTAPGYNQQYPISNQQNWSQPRTQFNNGSRNTFRAN
ncbi:MAG: hypothetical protein ACOYOK_06945 [Pseudobdellovibrionaceae bacterium]